VSGFGGRNVVEVANLIFELDGDVLQRGGVLAGVMGTKEQSAPGRQHRT